MGTQITDGTMQFTVRVEPATLELTADSEMIEQVLINLLMNSIQALEGQSDARISPVACMD
jgi:two-component system nitrogen regulation sensor histidine kinase NtrY